MTRPDHPSAASTFFGRVLNSVSSRSPPTSGIASNNGHAEKNTATQNGHAASGEVENHLGGVIGRSTEPPKASTFRRRSIWRKSTHGSGRSSVRNDPPQISLALPSLYNTAESNAPIDVSEEYSERFDTTADSEQHLISRKKVGSASNNIMNNVQLEHHRNARISISSAAELLDLCAREIKMRGLAVVGIFRPFQAAESNNEYTRLIELFLMSSDPKTYESIFTKEENSKLYVDTFGKADIRTEFKRKLAYANIHDVVSLFKWGLRRMRLRSNHLNSGSPLFWYESFLQKEKAGNYPTKAFSSLLLPALTSDAAKIFNTVFDLMSTVSAHHMANAMPAWRLCRIVGYWLIGQIDSTDETRSFAEMADSFGRASKITEHLLLTFIRNQSAEYHLMPSRLTELLESYPYFKGDSLSPSLPPAFSAKVGKALFVEVQTEVSAQEEVIVQRSPQQTLEAALTAKISKLESSEEVDDWNAIRQLTVSYEDRPATNEHLETLFDSDEHSMEEIRGIPKVDDIAEQIPILFKDDDVRILNIVANEYSRRKSIMKASPSYYSATAGWDTDAIHSVPLTHDSTYSFISSPTSTAITTPEAHCSPQKASVTFQSSLGKHNAALGVLNEDEDDVDWNVFSTGGFSASTSQVDDIRLDPAFRPKSELERAFEESDRADAAVTRRQPSRSGIGSLRRAKAQSRVRQSFVETPSRRSEPPHHILRGVHTTPFDECFAILWQDQLLDDCPYVRLPSLVCGQLRQSMASRLLCSSMGMGATSPNWLVISESITSPNHSPPQTQSSYQGWTTNFLKRSSSHIYSSGKFPDDDQQSMFSTKSGFSARFANTQRGIRRMRSILSGRKSNYMASSGSQIHLGESQLSDTLSTKRQAAIDAEIRDLQEAVTASRKQKEIEKHLQNKESEEERGREEEKRLALATSLNVLQPNESTKVIPFSATPNNVDPHRSNQSSPRSRYMDATDE